MGLLEVGPAKMGKPEKNQPRINFKSRRTVKTNQGAVSDSELDSSTQASSFLEKSLATIQASLQAIDGKIEALWENG